MGGRKSEDLEEMVCVGGRKSEELKEMVCGWEEK